MTHTKIKHRRLQVTAAVVLPLLPWAACSGDSESGDRGSGGSQDSTSPASSRPSTPALPTGSAPVHLDPADFTAGSDHPYFPLEPGTRWTFREIDERGTRCTSW